MSSYIQLHREKIRQILLFLSIFVGLLLVSHQPDNDTYFLLNHGRYVWNYGIPHTEPFTMHEGWHFVMQQWLTSAIYWKIYEFAGFKGLLGFVYAIGAILLYLHYRLCLYVSNGNRDMSAAVTAVVGIFVGRWFLVMRPQILSTTLLLLSVFLLEHYWHTGKKIFLIALVPISVLYINLHAALWPMLTVITIPFLLEAIWKRKKITSIQILLLDICIIIAGFINPYGLEDMTYVFKSYGTTLNFIAEIQPLSFGSALTEILLIFVIAVWLVYLRHRLPLRYLLLSLGVTYMAMTNLRSMFLFLTLGTFPLAYCLQNKHFQTEKDISKKRFYFRIVGIFLIIIIGGYAVWEHYQHPIQPEEDVQAMSYDAIDYLVSHENPQSIILWTDFNDGAYAEFNGIKTYADSRAEVFTKKLNGKDDVLQEYLKVERGELYYKDVLNKYPFTHILAPKYDILYTYLEHDNDYELIYDKESGDNGCRIYKRIR